MNPTAPIHWIAFAADQQIALGQPAQVAVDVKQFVDRHPETAVVILDSISSRTVEIDLRGSLQNVLDGLPASWDLEVASAEASAEASAGDEPAQEQARSRGRPRLGVVAREVTLLPRHWDWLGTQPGGASVALRKLVERARRSSAESDRMREATESAYRFMSVLASNAPGFEEASRSLFAGDIAKLTVQIQGWPSDVRVHLLNLAQRAAPIETGLPADGSLQDSTAVQS